MTRRTTSFTAGCAGFLVMLGAVDAGAADPFEAEFFVEGSPSETFGFDNVEQLFDSIDPDEFAAQLGYDCAGNACESVGTVINYRGLLINMNFAHDSDLLVFSIPGLDEQVTFAGAGGTVEAGRSHAIEQLKAYLKANEDGLLKRLLTLLAQTTPYDSLAGNPSSLMTQKMFGDFANGFTHKVSQIWACGSSAFNFYSDQPIQVAVVGGVSDIFAEAQARAAQLRAQNEIGIGAMVSATQAPNPLTGADLTTNTVTVPLSYTVKFDQDPGRKLRLDLPLSYSELEGAVAYAAGFGLAYTHPVRDDWTVTPAVGVGATGSEDLGAGGGVGSVSVTSAHTWRLGEFALSMGNSVGQYESLDIELGDYQAGADISNTVFSNGLLVSGPNSLIANSLVLEYSVVDTRITGDQVYSDFYDEFGVAVGYVNTEQGVIDSFFKAGVSYLVGDHDINALKLNLSLRF